VLPPTLCDSTIIVYDTITHNTTIEVYDTLRIDSVIVEQYVVIDVFTYEDDNYTTSLIRLKENQKYTLAKDTNKVTGLTSYITIWHDGVNFHSSRPFYHMYRYFTPAYHPLHYYKDHFEPFGTEHLSNPDGGWYYTSEINLYPIVYTFPVIDNRRVPIDRRKVFKDKYYGAIVCMEIGFEFAFDKYGRPIQTIWPIAPFAHGGSNNNIQCKFFIEFDEKDTVKPTPGNNYG
ncbi:unnamed protein product, partial [marine sediment metagenome]